MPWQKDSSFLAPQDPVLCRLKETHPLWHDLAWSEDLLHFMQLAKSILAIDPMFRIQHIRAESMLTRYQGYYYPGAFQVRIVETKHGKDDVKRSVCTLAHEIGHHIDYQILGADSRPLSEALGKMNEYHSTQDPRLLPHPLEYAEVVRSEHRAWDYGKEMLRIHTDFSDWEYINAEALRCTDSYVRTYFKILKFGESNGQAELP